MVRITRYQWLCYQTFRVFGWIAALVVPGWLARQAEEALGWLAVSVNDLEPAGIHRAELASDVDQIVFVLMILAYAGTLAMATGFSRFVDGLGQCPPKVRAPDAA